MGNNSEFSLYDYLHTIRKRIWVVIETIVLIVMIVMIATSVQKKTYTSNASILIKRSPVMVGSTLPYGYMQAFTNYMELIKSNVVIEEAVEIMISLKRQSDAKNYAEFTKIYKEKLPVHTQEYENSNITENKIAAAMNAMKFDVPSDISSRVSSSLSTNRVGNTDIIQITLNGENKDRTKIILDCIVEVFLKNSQNILVEEKTKRKEFIEKQISIMENTLSESENKLKDFQRAEKIFSIEDEVKRQQEILTELETEYSSTQIEYDKLSSTADSLLQKIKTNDFIKISFSGRSDSENIINFKNQLLILQQEKAKLSSLYKEDHPKMIALDNQIEQVKTTIKEELSLSLDNNEYKANPVKERIVDNLINTKVQLVEVSAKLNALEKIIIEKKKNFKSLPEKNYEFIKLQRKLKVTENIYSQLLQKYNEVQIEEAATRNEVKLVDFPVVRESGKGTKYFINFAMAIISGLITGLALAFLIEHLDRTIKTPEEAKYITNKKVYATIPIIKPIINENIISSYSPVITTLFEPNSIAAEQFRIMRTNLQFTIKHKKNSTFIITSSNPQEGKTIISCNTAVTIAQNGKKTLLIDTDLRRPNIHKVFGFDNTTGLTDIISGKNVSECIVHTDIENLDVLCAGAILPAPTEFINSIEFSDMVEQLKKQYECIIFDSPPVLPVTDTLLLSAFVDELIFIVNIRETNSQHVKKCFEMFNNVKVNVAGIVCNKVNVKNISGYYYKY